MPYLEAESVKLHYEEFGDGSPVVFCHGLAGHCEREIPWARILADSGYRVIVYSARGHGKSTPLADPAVYTFDAMTDDFSAVLDGLAIDGAIIGGGSMGAATTLAFTLRNPARVKALMQFGPAFGSQPIDMVAAGFAVFAEFIEEHGPDRAIDLIIERLPMVKEMADADPGLIEDMREQWNAHDRDSIVAAMKGVPTSHPFADIAELEAIAVPALIVAAPGDPIHPLAVAEEYSRRIPTSDLRVVPLSPPLYRDPEAMASLVSEFCNSIA